MNEQNKADAFIIGGGLAGLHLALSMIRKGFRPLVIDEADPVSSSRVAAGIINPITGRRFAFTWMYEHLKPVFLETYGYWEKEWGSSFFQETQIYRGVPENVLVNNLDARLHDSKYRKYCRKMTSVEIGALQSRLDFGSPGYVFEGYHLDTRHFMDLAIAFLQSDDRYVKGSFRTGTTMLQERRFEFKGFVTDKIIYCTGAAIQTNPLFRWVHMNPNKGEALLLQIDDWPRRDLIKNDVFFVPERENMVWAGSFNTWEFEDDNPSAEGCAYLVDRVKKVLRVPWTLVDHIAAVRPAVEDRRPVIGVHPEHPGIFLFNGFGSKGSSLIPYFAAEMPDFIWGSKKLSSRVDVRRFYH